MKARTRARESEEEKAKGARSLDLSLKLRAVLLLGFFERHIFISLSLSHSPDSISSKILEG